MRRSDTCFANATGEQGVASMADAGDRKPLAGAARFIVGARCLWVAMAVALVALSLARIDRIWPLDPDARVFFAPENPDRQALDRFEATFAKDDNLLISIEPAGGDVFAPEVNGANGFRINGAISYGGGVYAELGFSVSGAGDVNGDGFQDIVIGARGATPDGYYGSRGAGQAFVIFGSDQAFAATLDVSTLDGAAGFSISGRDVYDYASHAVAAAGDVNGDGFDDVLVTAPFYNGGAGETYVVFGAATFGANFDLNDLANAAATTGVRITGAYAGENSGLAADTAGDFNGDGFDDLIVGIRERNSNAGSAIVVAGDDFDGIVDVLGTNGDDDGVGALVGDAGANIFVAGEGDDIMLGGGGADSFRGGEGDDIMEIIDLTYRRVDGGAGTDTLRIEALGLDVDFTQAGNERVTDVEAIALNASDMTVTLDTLSVLNLSSTSNKVKISVADPSSDFVLADLGSWSAVSASTTSLTIQSGQAQIEMGLDVPLASAFQIPPLNLFELSALDGTQGFKITNEDGSGDDFYGQFGFAVSGAGDVNGDGFEDFIVGAYYSNYVGSGDIRGGGVVVFGSAAGLPLDTLTGDLDGADGFRFTGGAYDMAGFSVSGAGDINGDGFADLIIGGEGDSLGYGVAYVVFGTDQGFAADVDLSALGASGFSIVGGASGELIGLNVAGAGDFNGDGFDDIIVSGEGVTANGNFLSGESYIIFGTDAGFGASFDVTTIDGTNGVALGGPNDYAYSSVSVSSAGDVNGDGLDDVAIGIRSNYGLGYGNNQSVAILFGTADPQADLGAAFDLGNINTNLGFFLYGGNIVNQIASAGDINGDGFDDIIVSERYSATRSGDYSGRSFVIFGTATPANLFVNVSNLNVSVDGTGFRVEGPQDDDNLGATVSAAGDVNGDGFDDLIIGGPGISGDGGPYPASSVVLFGRPTGDFDDVIDPTTFDGTDGFNIDDAVAGDFAGQGVSIIGDINGDGFDDLLIGAPGAQNAYYSTVGAAFVLFGGDTGAVSQAGDENANTLTGTAGADVLVGGGGNDLIFGLGGADTLIGGEGDDDLQVGDLTFQRIDGGTGIDFLTFNASNLDLDLTIVGSQGVTDIEGIALTDGTNSDNTITLDALSVLDLSSTTNRLTITGLGADGHALRLTDAGWRSTFLDANTLRLENGQAVVEFNPGLGLIVDVNSVPVPNDDAYAVNEDDQLTVDGIGLASLIANDVDADNDLLVVDGAPVDGPNNGAIVLNSDGTFVYTPDSDFSGTDTFVYRVRDFTGGVADGTVTITVNAVNDAPVAVDDSFSTDEDTALTTGNVLANDADVDIGDTLTVAQVNGAVGNVGVPILSGAGAALTLNADGTFDYDPNGQFEFLPQGATATDTFTYVAEDQNGEPAAEATVTITINGVNDAPTAVDDNAATDEATPVSGDVLLNDIEPDQFDTLTVSEVESSGSLVGIQFSLVSGAQLTMNANGTFDYDPNGVFDNLSAGQTATDVFSYQVSDSAGATDIANVTITISGLNDAPTATDDAFATDEDTVLAIPSTVLDNDVDPDAADTLTVAAVNGAAANVDTEIALASGALLTLRTDGTFEYDPNGQFETLAVGASATDTFTYIAEDQNGAAANEATVTITVNGANDPPTANADGFVTNEDVAIIGVDLIGNPADVSLNDVDIDGDTLTYSLVQQFAPVFGTVVLNSDGTFTYTPDPDANNDNQGQFDGFVYQVTDGNGGVRQGNVNIQVLAVNDPPTIVDDLATTDQDSQVSGNVLANDDDVEDGSAGLRVAAVQGNALLVNQPAQTDLGGLVTVSSLNGAFDYDPNGQFDDLGVGESRDDTFTYTAVDTDGTLVEGTVTVTVNGLNDAPTAVDDLFTAADNVILSGDVFVDNGLGVDFDIDGDAFSVVEVNGNAGSVNAAITLASGATLTMLNDGTFDYQPANGFLGDDTFAYTIADSGGLTSEATVTVTVVEGVQPLVASDDAFTLQQGDAVTGNLFNDNGAGQDVNPNGGDLFLNVAPVTAPINGGVILRANGTFTYTPDPSFFGTDSFVYEITDGDGLTAEATVDITVLEDTAGVVRGTTGNDVVNGDGTTVIAYDQGATTAIFADLNAGFVNAGSFGLDQVRGIFEVGGTTFGDVLFGTNANPGAASPQFLLGAFESFQGMAGDDIVFAAGGLDRINYINAPAGVNVDLGQSIAFDDGFGDVDTLFGVEGVQGTRFDDILVGSAGANFFEPFRGNDSIDGKGGIDALIFINIGSAVVADLEAGQVVHANGDVATFSSIENFEGGAGSDDIRGSGAANVIAGNAGDEGAPVIDNTLMDVGVRRRTGCSVVAVRRGAENLPAVGPDTVLLAGDTVVVLGPDDRLPDAQAMFTTAAPQAHAADS